MAYKTVPWTPPVPEVERDVPAARSRIEAEVAAAVVEWARTALQMSADEVATTLSVSDRTVKRWAQRRSGPAADQRAALRKLHKLHHLTEAVFTGPEAALKWFHSPSEAFQGDAPIQVALDGRLDKVLAVLAAVDSGSHF